MKNTSNDCLKCLQISQTLNALKLENIELKDKLLICEQQNIALNNVKIESIKCIEVLNKIVSQLTINNNRNENKETIDKNDGKSDQKKTIESLKCDYNESYNRLEDWFQQIHLIKSITRFPRIKCGQYEEKSVIRRSNRLSLPVAHFTPFTETLTKIEKSFIKKCEESPPPLISSKSKSSGEQRLRCPFPKCGFSTRRGVEGLKEHSVCHTRSHTSHDTHSESDVKPFTSELNTIMASKDKKKSNVDKSKKRKKQLFRCSYPKCSYVSRYGMFQIRRHIKSIHSKKMPSVKSSIENNDNINNSAKKVLIDLDMNDVTENDVDLDEKSRPILRCSYTDCKYETRWGMSKLRLHMTIHTKPKLPKTKTKSRGLISIKPQNKVKTNLKRLGTSLSCTKCSYKTKWGLGTLRKHMKIHGSERPFKCDKCDASYTRLQPLNLHKNQLHKESDNSLTDDNVSVGMSEMSETITERCNVCNKEFKSSYNLTKHLRIHEKINNQSYECPHENCFFKTNIIEIFQKHVVIHIMQGKKKPKRKPKAKTKRQVSNKSTKMNHSNDSVLNDSIVNDSTVNDSIVNETVVQFLPIKVEDEDKPEPQLEPIEISENAYSQAMSSTPKESNNTELFNYGSHIVSKSVNRKAKTRKSTPIQPKPTINQLNSNESTEEQQIETPLSNRLLQTLLKTSSTIQYKCDAPRCGFTSFNAEEWIKHNDTHEVVAYKCSKCRKSYPKKNLLEAHKRLKDHLDEYNCSFPDCNIKFRAKYALTNHYNATHKPVSGASNVESNITRIPCDFAECSKTFTRRDSMLKHLHNSHRIKCIAKKSTTYAVTHNSFNSSTIEQNVFNHFNETPNSLFNSYLINCPSIGCNESFDMRASMISHFNKCHQNCEYINIADESSRCPDCGLLFTNVSNMRRHKSLAHKYSRSTFETNSTFETSIFSNNGSYSSLDENRTYLCQRNGCGKVFDSALNLREHLNLEHNKYISSTITNQSFQDMDQSVNTCHICGIHFPALYQLQEHLRAVHEQQLPQQDIPFTETEVDNTIPINENMFTIIEPDFANNFEPSVNNENNNNNNNNNILNYIKIEQI